MDREPRIAPTIFAALVSLLLVSSSAQGQTTKDTPKIETTAVAILHCLHMAQNDGNPHLPWSYTASHFTKEEAQGLGRRLRPEGFLPDDDLGHTTFFTARVGGWERVWRGRVRVGLHLLWDRGDVAHEFMATVHLKRKPTGWTVDRRRSTFVGGE